MNAELLLYFLAGSTISMEILGGIVLLVILFSIVLGGDSRNRTSHLFAQAVLSLSLSMFFEAGTWLLETRSGSVYYYLLMVINVISHSLVAFFQFAVVRYTFSLISEKTVMKRYLNNILTDWYIMVQLFVLVSLPGKLIFYIDQNNIYQYGSLYWLYYLLGIAMSIYGAVCLIAYRRVFPLKEALLLLFYMILLIVGFLLQLVNVNLILSHVFAMVAILVIYLNIQSQRGKGMKEQELEVMESRIAVMLSQIQPHFLYNSLSAIEKLCDIDAERAKTAINDFAHYLRGNLNSIQEKRLIMFTNELEHVDTYIGLEKLRFDDKLQVVYDIETEDFVLPPLTLQPIVENAIRYGITKKKEGGVVSISVREEKDYICISVIDNGMGFDASAFKQDGRAHIGIDSVRKRLEMLCNGTLEINSTLGEGTTAIIMIPKRDMHQYS